ncbi:MAG: PD-(D/E)XK nuclease family protein [Wenzhouxiangella sp.]|jgi:probable DNA repair protein|nr:PD-(D/E)XK nuclease family protein [Wenzhouxiangella sp.]
MIQSYAPTLLLTPTARLARNEQRKYAELQRKAGDSAWQNPAILPLQGWLHSLARDALIHGLTDRVPISADQARPIWQEVIDQEVFAGEARVHSLCERAWRTIHEYGLPHPGVWPTTLLCEDSRRFRNWAARFEARCRELDLIEQWSLLSEVPEWIRSGRLQTPESVRLLNFERALAPLISKIFESMRDAGADIQGLPDGVARDLPSGIELLQFTTPEDEIAAAASWARAQLEASPDSSIAVVVPDLSTRLASVERCFRRQFDPCGFALEGHSTEAWHISLGPPLAEWPLVSDLLLLLRLNSYSLSQIDAGRLLQSPYLRGAESEAHARLETHALLLTEAPYEITFEELARTCQRAEADQLALALRAFVQERKKTPRSTWPSDWVAQFQKELDTVGAGHGRSLDSVEWQVLSRWHELLEQFATLDSTLDQPISRTRALRLLTEQARNTAFRQRNPGCPVEILGVEEALGSAFDHLWITTLDSAHWPGAVRRDPLIPASLQIPLPQASTEGCVRQAEQDLSRLLECGRRHRLSYAIGSDEAPLEPCRLLPDVLIQKAEGHIANEVAPLENLGEDTVGPKGLAGRTAGGVSLLKDQSACPFRAFARYRLDARALNPPRPGLDGAARGSLRHWALETFWQDLSGREALKALSPSDLEERIAEASEQALQRLTRKYRRTLIGAARDLEKTSLTRLLRRWLAIEKDRTLDFRVQQPEQSIDLEFGGLKLTARVDRIDETDAGHILVDYKTGDAQRSNWLPDPRLADPQLPAYALSQSPRPVAISFVKLRPDQLSFEGLSEANLEIKGVQRVGQDSGCWKQAEDWAALLAAWQDNLDSLGQAHLNGKAAVDPRKPDVCRYCQLHALCRIHQRRGFRIVPEAGS